MAFDLLALVRPAARGLAPFVPGRPVEELERRLGIAHAIQLLSNENALAPSPRVIEAVARAVSGVHRYPDAGAHALKERLAGTLGVTPAHLAIGNGSNELIELLVHLFVDAGDEVVASDPTFVMYGISVRLMGGTLVAVPGVPRGGPGHAHDLDAMAAAITPKTRMILVCNPNNPTGAIVRRPEWQRFLAAVPRDVVVVSDEAYCEYVEDPAFPDTLKDLARDQPLVLLRTFSKVHSLAGLRVGYAIASPAMAALFDRVRLPYNVNRLGQVAALAALDDPAHVERSRALARAGREWLAPQLHTLGVTTFESHTNFLLADLGRDSRPVCAALAESGVLVRDMVGFGMAPAFARITIGTQAENERLIAALAPLLAGAPHAARSA